VGEPRRSFPECALRATKDTIEVVVDGAVRARLSPDDYRRHESQLSSNNPRGPFTIDLPSGEISVRIPPIFELRRGAVALHTDDGEVYGRRYRIGALTDEEVTLVDAHTAEIVGAIPRREFTKRVRLGLTRSACTYAEMLGEHSEELHRKIVGKPYNEEEAAAEEEAKIRSWEEEREARFQRRALSGARLRAWLNAHPAVVVIALVLIMVFLIRLLPAWLAGPEPVLGQGPAPVRQDPRALDREIERYMEETLEARRSATDEAEGQSALARLRLKYEILRAEHPGNDLVREWGKLLNAPKEGHDDDTP
jgi:hypothetical protein